MGGGSGHALSVSGEGEVHARPDLVHLTLGVEVKNENLDAALADATKRVNALRDALLKLGVREADMKTGQLSIGTFREPVTVHVAQPAPAPEKSSGKMAPVAEPVVVAEERWIERYVVSTNFDVKFAKIERTGELVKAAVAAGANQSWGINFELSDPKPLTEEARALAVKDARRRAEQLAEAAGVKLGRVLSVSEGSEAPGPMPMMRMAKASMESDSMAIEGGETIVRSNVTLVYAIEE